MGKPGQAGLTFKCLTLNYNSVSYTRIILAQKLRVTAINMPFFPFFPWNHLPQSKQISSCGLIKTFELKLQQVIINRESVWKITRLFHKNGENSPSALSHTESVPELEPLEERGEAGWTAQSRRCARTGVGEPPSSSTGCYYRQPPRLCRGKKSNSVFFSVSSNKDRLKEKKGPYRSQ